VDNWKNITNSKNSFGGTFSFSNCHIIGLDTGSLVLIVFGFTITFAGYGHISPSDVGGQLSLVLYTIIGLPLMMVFLANIGGVMAKALKYSFSRLCCRWCRAKRKFAEIRGTKTAETSAAAEISLKTDEVGFETYMPTEYVKIIF
jgi:hypothetical protein